MTEQLKPLPICQPGQDWCCENGCGATTPRLKPFEYSREEDLNGNLIESKSVMVWRSACCGAGLFLYDETTGEATDWED